MVIGSGISPTDFRISVTLIERKLCELATKLGVPDSECADLDGLLAALPEIGRSRARAMLNGIQVTAADDHPRDGFGCALCEHARERDLGCHTRQLGRPGIGAVGAAVKPVR